MLSKGTAAWTPDGFSSSVCEIAEVATSADWLVHATPRVKYEFVHEKVVVSVAEASQPASLAM